MLFRSRDPVVIALRRRVTATIDEGMATDAAGASVTLDDGRVLDLYLPHCKGSLDNPLTDAELDDKLRAQAQGVLPAERVDALLRALWSVDALPDAGVLGALATPSGAA